MNQEQINTDLRTKKSTESPFQRHLVDIYRSFMVQSAGQMGQYWEIWDKDYEKYCGYRKVDKEDVQNKKAGGTEKIIVPLTFAQVQTAAAGILQMFMNKERLYELVSYGPEDEQIREGLERDIDYQLRQNRIYHTIYLQIVDALTKGMLVGRCDWETVKRKYRVREPQISISPMEMLMAQMEGRQPQMTTEIVETVKELVQYEGNRISYISPYTFYPDPNVPLRDFQSGSFCAIEQSTPKIILKEREGNLLHGVDLIPNAIPEDIYRGRKRYAGNFRTRRNGTSYINTVLGNKVSTGSNVDVVEMFLKLVPKEISEKYDIDIGDENVPVMFVLVVANDTKVIRFERYNELHGKFPFYVSQFSPDGDSFIGQSIPRLLDGIQSLMTWLLNSHMQNVRQAIKNRFLINPGRVNMDDVQNNANYIRVNGSNSLGDSIMPLNVVDITNQHIPFMQYMQQIAQMTTGINENAMGLYSGGRRSAAQTRGIQASGQARIALAANNLWYSGYDTLGELILSNTRQFRTKEIYDQILGDAAAQYPFEQAILADPEKIAGGFDFVPLEALSDAGRSQIVMLAKELLADPNLIQATNLSPDKILGKIFELLGIRNYEYFKQEQQPQAQPQEAQVPNMEVLPDEQVAAMVQQGQLSPVAPQEAMPVAGALGVA